MSRYRTVDVRLWSSDSKFRLLTPLEPSGQGLWLYLLTSPYQTNIPGLFRANEGALAGDLKWSVERFRERFRELSGNGFAKADWGAQIVWLPKAIKYNRPANPNVVTGWRTTWDELPECELKEEARQSLKLFLEGLGERYTERFLEACPNGMGNGLGNRRGNQDQEQEQDQDQDQDLSLPPYPPQGESGVLGQVEAEREFIHGKGKFGGKERVAPVGEGPAKVHDGKPDGFEEFWRAYPKRSRSGKQDARKAYTKLRVTPERHLLIMQSLAAWMKTDQWQRGFIPWPQKFLNRGLCNEFPEPSSATEWEPPEDRARDGDQTGLAPLFLDDKGEYAGEEPEEKNITPESWEES